MLDLLGEGELFGHASMLSGLPSAFAVRAHEDTLCYRIPADACRPVLARPPALLRRGPLAGGRHERALALDPVRRRLDPARAAAVATLLRGRAVVASPETPCARPPAA